jgi:hypothetical protein
MGELSVYFVPNDQVRWFNRERDIAEAFWSRGVFLATPDRFIYERLAEYKAQGRPLPPWKHAFTFSDMGIASSALEDPVPSGYLELHCPSCKTDISEAAHDVWGDEESTVPTPSRTITCPSCEATHAGATLLCTDSEFTFASVYMWVSDIDEDDWDASFKTTVEEVLGPCRQFMAWDT